MLEEYFPVLIFIIIGVLIGLVPIALGSIVSPRKPELEKYSPYECGFEPFEDTRIKFDIKFYLVSILFIIFDMEIVFLFPWTIVVYKIGFFGFFVMILFLIILFLGFFYEWWVGALDWE